MIVNVSRREALFGFGALVLGFELAGCGGEPAGPTVDATISLGPSPSGVDTEVTGWVRVAANGVVTLRVPVSEMGQGVFTALPMVLAEELDVRWADVRAETAPAHAMFGRPRETGGTTQGVGGSYSVRGYDAILRLAGATARAMLVGAAAKRWGVKPADCTVADGVVTAGGNTATYGELAAEAALLPVPEATPKARSAHTLVGTSPPRLDLPSKVDGSAVFGIDVVRPGMVVATPRRCPHFGGKIATVDDADARTKPGVLDVLQIDDDTVVVVADTFWHAKQGLAAVQVTWDKGPDGALDDVGIRKILIAALDRAFEVQGGREVPTPAIEATYEVPYLEHAPIEPLSATVDLQPTRCDVWVSTQFQSSSQSVTAELTGLPKDACFVHTPFLGGGFGRRSETDFVEIAVKVAQRVGKPVKVLWTREEVFARGMYRPIALCRMRASVDADGTVHLDSALAMPNLAVKFLPAVLADTSLASGIAHEGLSGRAYSVDHRVTYAPVHLPIPFGFWRSVHGSSNAFFRECFLDEVAGHLGKDAIALRREWLAKNPRQLAVLDLALEQAGPVPEGLSRGVALFDCFGSIVAHVIDLSVADGKIAIKRATAAIDCGRVVHPDIVKAQVMGATGMGLSAALFEGVSIKDCAAVPTSFANYRLLKLAEMPATEVHIVPSDAEPGGVGEPGLPPAMAALVNALFAATGKRVRTLPIGDQLSA